MIKLVKYFLIPLLLIVTAENSIGQSKQYWSTLEYKLLQSQQMNYGFDGGIRLAWAPEFWEQDYIRFTSRYFLNYDNSLVGGISYYRVQEYDYPNIHEIRPFQGYKLRFLKIFPYLLNHYFRIEERIKFGNFPATIDFRFRYQLKTTIPIAELKKSGNLLSFTPAVELFFDIDKAKHETLADRYRITLGLEYDVFGRYKIDLAYLCINNMDVIIDNAVFDTHIIRLRFTIFQKNQ